MKKSAKYLQVIAIVGALLFALSGCGNTSGGDETTNSASESVTSSEETTSSSSETTSAQGSGSEAEGTDMYTLFNLALMSEASQDSEVLSECPAGTKVTVISNDGYWSEVSMDGTQGYMSGLLLGESEGESLKFSLDSLDSSKYVSYADDYPSCEDGSEGTVFIYYSDGTSGRIDY